MAIGEVIEVQQQNLQPSQRVYDRIPAYGSFVKVRDEIYWYMVLCPEHIPEA